MNITWSGMQTKYWFDTEFMEDGKTIDLISIGIVSDDGRTFYAESLDADYTKANSFVREHVFPHLDLARYGQARSVIRRDLLEYIGNTSPEFWTYFGSYDWVCLAQLFGTMMDFPRGWPMFPMDVMQLMVETGVYWKPRRHEVVHNALEDALWTKEMHDGIRERLCLGVGSHDIPSTLLTPVG